MRLLGLETSGDTSSVALWADGEVLAERVFASHQTICQVLATEILALLGTETVRAGVLDGIAVSVGPGSFTGLRVGVTTAKALAYACRIPVVGVGTPLAWAAETRAEPGSLIVVLQPARRGKLYLTAFEQTAAAHATTSQETCVVDVSEAANAALSLAAGRRLVLTGNALGREPQLVTTLTGQAEVCISASDSPRASTIAYLGAPALGRTAPDSCFTLRPVYVLLSQAERARGVDLGL